MQHSLITKSPPYDKQCNWKPNQPADRPQHRIDKPQLEYPEPLPAELCKEDHAEKTTPEPAACCCKRADRANESAPNAPPEATRKPRARYEETTKETSGAKEAGREREPTTPTN